MTLPLLVLIASTLSAAGQDAASNGPACMSPELLQAVHAVQAAAADEDLAYSLTERLVLEVGKRPAGTEAEVRARRWAMQELGVAGLEDVRAEPFEFTGWTQQDVAANVRTPVAHRLHAVALGGSPGSAVALQAPLVRFASLDALRAAPAGQLAGQAVFLDVPMTRTRDRSGYMAAVKARRDGPTLAAAAGARFLLLRSIGTDQSSQPHAGMAHHAAGREAIPAVAISIADANLLARLLSTAAHVEVDVHVRTASRRAQSANVRARLAAPGEPARVHSGSVILAAHLDSWHVGVGASDDASGVGSVLAAARLLRPHRALLRRDIEVLLFGAEEMEMAGAHAYVAAHGEELDHVAAVESDLGSGRLWRLLLPDPQRPTAAELALASVLEPLGIGLSLSLPAIGGPDVGLLKTHGTRVYDLDPDASSYFDIHHTDEDTLEHVSAENLRQHVAGLASFALLMASVEERCLR